MNSKGRGSEGDRRFLISLAAFPALYFLTPLLPLRGGGVLLGAAAVTAFAFLFIEAGVRRLWKRDLPPFLLAATVALSSFGVWGVNRSLYNFERTPSVSAPNLFVERSGEVLFSTFRRIL